MTDKETDVSAVKGGQDTAGVTEALLDTLPTDSTARASSETSSSVEDVTRTLLGEAEAAENRRDVQDKEVPDALADKEAKDTKEAKEAKGDEDFDLPWNPDRQRQDQANANLRKMVQRQGEQIDLLTKRLDDGPSPEVELDAILNELGEVVQPEPSDELDEDAVRQYKLQLNESRVKQAKLATKAKEIRKKMAERSTGKESEAQEEEKDVPKLPTKAQFIAFCEEAEAEFGSTLRKTGRVAARDEIVALGYGPKKAPTLAALQKIVVRVYRSLAKPKSKPSVKEPKERQQQRTEGQPLAHAPPKAKMTTVHDAANAMRRRARAGG